MPLAEAVPPKRQPKRLLPSQFAAADKPGLLVGSRRHQIVLREGRVELMIGPRVDWAAGLAEELPGLADIARVVRRSPHPDWLTEPRPRIFVLRAALVQAERTRLVIAAPRVKLLRMISTGVVDQEVYLSGVAAEVTINGVTVTSWRDDDTPDPVPALRRPFVSYDQPGSVLTVTNARFSYLGGDSILAYGVTWGRGTTGSAVGSTFDHNFFGAYSNAAVGLLFLRNTFRDNDLYGLDPHSDSRYLRIEDNEAFDNGSHGIIFSVNVVDSVVIGNRSFGNRVNGIMMDEHSDRNVLRDNQTWSNEGDGIVVQNSSKVLVSDNLSTGNRVGIRVTGKSLDSVLSANRLIGNRRGIEVYSGPAVAVGVKTTTLVTRNQITGDRRGDGILVKDFAGVRITGNTVHKYVNGILLSGSSPRARVTANKLTGQVRGIEVDAEVTGARLTHNVIESARERGLVLAGPRSVSEYDTITGSDIGVDVRNDAAVTGVRVHDGRRGINLVSGTTTVAAADIAVHEYGVNVDRSAELRLHQSRIIADHPVVGAKFPKSAGNEVGNPPPPFPWLALAGVLFVLIAVCLHLAHRRRAPACHPRRTAAPTGVRNAW
jgi:hypothetical protein